LEISKKILIFAVFKNDESWLVKRKVKEKLKSKINVS
jgi:hypothetical protein